MYSNFKEQAIEYVRQAIAEDNAGNYARAFPLYMNALEYFKTHLKYEKNPKIKEAITLKFTEYLRRAEEIRAVLDDWGPGPAANGGDAAVATRPKTKPKDGKDGDDAALQNPETLMASPAVQEVLPPTLDSTSEPPPVFDGTTRLYVNYQCPYVQRVWIVRNYKGLLDEIKLVPIDLQNRPAWYKEKVYPQNKVPALEHNGKIIGESLDLVKYIDANFKGPSLLPDDPAKQKFIEELLAHSDTFLKVVFTSFRAQDPIKQAGTEFDYLETALQKFDDGPFFVGQFSQADVAYVPFIERFLILFQEFYKYDITSGRPTLAKWIEETNKIDAYKPTKCDTEQLIPLYKARFGV